MSWARRWLILWFAASFLTAILLPATRYELSRTLVHPSLFHPFGFDAFGRDVLLLTLKASLTSCLFAFSALVASSAISIWLGLLIAVAPKKMSFVFSRFLELILAFPALLFALAWAAIRGPGWSTLAFALLIGTVPSFTRLVASRSQEILAEDYVAASISLGAEKWRIATSHLLPSVFSLCLVKAPGLFAGALISEATLSFLGVGAPIGEDTWGSLLAQARDYLLEAPHISVGAGLPLFVTVLCLQIISEGSNRKYV